SAGPALAQEGTESSASILSVSGCAAVVSTTDICTTCVTAACVVPATITAGCGGCGDAPPTVYRSFPCDQGCDNIGCKTVYSVVTATESVCAASPSPTPTGGPDGSASGSGNEAVTSATSVSTAGAARVRPFRLW
ncbi:hypothetical protein C8A01DRAFT_20258, partial [Parachaetomium inaequale]